ncbi:hypothetical protein [Ktedonobacter robiniae]|uniref:Transposase DDE domain-containing protein n=1 Tax=Ktedonobacter robiniae TaxID=2778365 RepID=A0ABQ3UUB8_9CHLR|nr:hypothetical protein [Ktedonobacter robiniae]GHO56298.1 hypothetical protein KSB_47730 [Ktedonobacter robiniae]
MSRLFTRALLSLMTKRPYVILTRWGGIVLLVIVGMLLIAHVPAPSPALAPGYGPPTTASSWKTGRFSGQDFPLQPDGTLRCPAGQPLHAQEQRREADGSLRVVYAASIRSCRPCPLREQCQWQGNATAKPRQVSVLQHPLVIGSAPVLWHDWNRRYHRRVCMQLLRHQNVEVQVEQKLSANPTLAPTPAQRAHYRLLWAERLAHNARGRSAPDVAITLFGAPLATAHVLSLKTV